MIKRRYYLCLLPMVASLSVFAQLSANGALTSDYLFRGFSQTDEGPAVQAGLDYTFDSGFALGTWASNVTFGDEKDVEYDLFATYSHAWDDLSMDMGYIAYRYLDLEGADADDLWLGITYKSFGFKLWRGLEVEWTYLDLNYDVSLPKDWSLGLHAGFWDFDDGGDVTDWKIGVSKGFKHFDMEIAYTDTDTENDTTADARAYLMLSKSWTFK